MGQDTTIEQNLEKGADRDKWRRWTEMAIGEPEDESFEAHSRSHTHRKKFEVLNNSKTVE